MDVPPEASATGGAADLKFKALPLRQNEWANWFESQLGTSKATQEKGLYLGLRMDGRVRTSGMGPAPWERFIAQIPPTSGDQSAPPPLPLCRVLVWCHPCLGGINPQNSASFV